MIWLHILFLWYDSRTETYQMYGPANVWNNSKCMLMFSYKNNWKHNDSKLMVLIQNGITSTQPLHCWYEILNWGNPIEPLAACHCASNSFCKNKIPRHLTLVHTIERPYICYVCVCKSYQRNKIWNHRTNLHIMSIRCNNETFVANQINIVQTWQSILKIYIVIVRLATNIVCFAVNQIRPLQIRR